ncbi:MAG: beta-ketoacyl-[acyl-carrier-protein] synthase family protein [Actinomycetota bacterium]
MTSAIVRGLGVVSPLGSDLNSFSRSLVDAAETRAVVARTTRYELEYLACHASGFEPADRFERHELRRLDRAHLMAFWAADDALAMVGDGPDPERCAVVVGTGFGAAGSHEAQSEAWRDRGPRAVSPLTIPVVMSNSIAAHLAIRLGWTGPALTIATACASGADAIGEALWLLRTGRADRVLAGGVDALHVEHVVTAFLRMEAMSSRLDDPGSASRPFDADRDGFVMGEGAGFVVLERDDGSVTGLGTVFGYGVNNDAHHIVAPPDGGAGAAACVRAALVDAGIEPSDIAHVNAHGTSTSRNDAAEAAALADVFGPSAVPVTATKAVMGHLVGGAGAVECIAAVLTAQSGDLPGVRTLSTLDPEIDGLIDVSSDRRSIDPGPALSTSFGFGGHNACLVVG